MNCSCLLIPCKGAVLTCLSNLFCVTHHLSVGTNNENVHKISHWPVLPLSHVLKIIYGSCWMTTKLAIGHVEWPQSWDIVVNLLVTWPQTTMCTKFTTLTWRHPPPSNHRHPSLLAAKNPSRKWRCKVASQERRSSSHATLLCSFRCKNYVSLLPRRFHFVC